MNEKEIVQLLSFTRLWVWPDNPISDDGNAGTFEKPFKTYEVAASIAEHDNIIIVIPERSELYKEKYKDLYKITSPT